MWSVTWSSSTGPTLIGRGETIHQILLLCATALVLQRRGDIQLSTIADEKVREAVIEFFDRHPEFVMLDEEM